MGKTISTVSIFRQYENSPLFPKFRCRALSCRTTTQQPCRSRRPYSPIVIEQTGTIFSTIPPLCSYWSIQPASRGLQNRPLRGADFVRIEKLILLESQRAEALTYFLPSGSDPERGAVALQAGNSPGMICKHYRELV